MLALQRHAPRSLRIILFLAALYAYCWVKGWPRYYDDEELPPQKRPNSSTMGPDHIGHDQLIVSVTTTAVDALTKIPPLLVLTAEEHHGQLLLFSDLQMELGRWPIFDVLWRYEHEFIEGETGLEGYRTQVDYAQGSLPISGLRKQDKKEEEERLATLDKYKILQTMAAAWEYRPDRAWYVFTGDETYVNRVNLLDWLNQYDSKSKHFFGNPPTPEYPDPFAGVGNSIIVSHQVMKELFKDRKDLIKVWQKRIADYSSAFDLIFNVLQSELKVGLAGIWPGISGYNPSTAPFSPTSWCEPILMMHHVTADIASDLWKLEKDRADNHPSTNPLRFADLWDYFMRPEILNHTRNEWDNLSSEPSNSRWNLQFEGDTPDGGKAKNGEESVEQCEQSCIKSEYCMQWSYSSLPQENWNNNPRTKCHLSSSVRLGAHVAHKGVVFEDRREVLTWTSGWRKAKFTAWATQQRCQAQHQR